MTQIASGRRRHRRRWFVAGALAVVALAPAACGVPGNGKPIIDGDARAKSSQGGSGDVIAPTPGAFSDPTLLVNQGYLEAIAGQVTPAAQADAATAFMTPGEAKTWKPSSQQITVVRVLGKPHQTQTATGFLVTDTVLTVGTFDPQSGALSAPPSTETTALNFEIVVAPNGEMRLTNVPTGMFMIDDALHQLDYYEPHVIYFWDSHHGLIPDLRYLPAGTSPRKEATDIVNWILNGPPAWMAGVANPPTPGVSLTDSTIPTSPANDNMFVVNLNSAARALSPGDQIDLLSQIRWSLGDISPTGQSFGASPVTLQIPNQPPRTDSDASYTTTNQAFNRSPDPTAFAIGAGKVRPIDLTKTPTVPILTGTTANTHVLLAAINQSQSLAALVRSVGGKAQLWIRRNVSGAFEQVITAKQMSRPVWLVQPNGYLAIVADGKFVLVKPNDKTVSVPVPNIGSVSAFSVAPDGRQVAFVAGGKLWTSLLEVGSPPSLTPPRLINLNPALNKVTAVAWSAIDQLVVAGAGPDGSAAIETFVDGSYSASASKLSALGSTDISQIVSYPPAPTDSGQGSEDVMRQTSGGFACSGRAQCQPLRWKPAATGEQPTSPFYPD